jgi:hypothetical protein
MSEYAENAIQMKAIAVKRYQWRRIAGLYKSLFIHIVTSAESLPLPTHSTT